MAMPGLRMSRPENSGLSGWIAAAKTRRLHDARQKPVHKSRP
jgi:hypothetical protein